MKAILQPSRRRPARRAGKASLPKMPVAKQRLTLAQLLCHPAFGMWKDKTISVEAEVRQWRKPCYGVG